MEFMNVSEEEVNSKTLDAPSVSAPLPTLEVRGLSIAYTTAAGKRLSVAEDIFLSLYAGQMTALVGESGCKKA